MKNADFTGLAFPVSATVVIAENRRRAGRKKDVVVAQLDEHIRINASHLERYCFASPTNQAVDLLTVLGAVRFADRAIGRKRSAGWGRRIEVQVPVFEPRRWSAPEISNALDDCLSYLTGDSWHFEFTSRKSSGNSSAGHVSPVVSLPTAEYVGIPYSDGLDSYAQARLLLEREPDVNLICTFTNSKGGAQSWEALCKAQTRADRIQSIPVPMGVKEPHHSEPTFRSRPFIFYSLAAYGAALAGSKRVLIPENGQGSIGGSLVLIGNEAPHRSCYPGFLLRLGRLLSALLQREIAFEQPGLLLTKGQVISELIKLEGQQAWTGKWSCSHDQRHSHLDGARVHCGVCGGCVLRRVSLAAANVRDDTAYLFERLSAPTLEEALAKAGEVRAIKAMKDVAGNSIRDMQRLSELASASGDSRIQEMALDVAEAQGKSAEEALQGLRALLDAHRNEWTKFVETCGQQSWVRKFAEA